MPIRSSALLLGMTIACGLAQAQSDRGVEVMHWWTSGGEARALAALREAAEREGLAWKDSPIIGGGGDSAMRTLRARVNAGMPPTAVQVMGLEVEEWARRGVLANLDGVAAREHWDEVVPPALQRFSKVGGHWVAVPVNVHSYNWVWANRRVLAEAGVNAEPRTWDEFIAAAHKVRDAGHVALAHGGQPWQNAMVFDAVVLATGGADFHRKAFVQGQDKAVASPTLELVFKRMSQLRALVDKDHAGRAWNFASAMVINGRAAFQIMGDFAKGEFLAAGQLPGRDFLCFRVPGSQGAVSFGIDNFAMFSMPGTEQSGAQKTLARLMLDRRFQSDFNVLKGSVPARTDVPDDAFDDCGKKGMRELAQASRRAQLVGTVVFGHAVPGPLRDQIVDIVDRHFNGKLDDAEATAAMAAVLRRRGAALGQP